MKRLIFFLLILFAACSEQPQSTILPHSVTDDVFGDEGDFNLQGASSGGGLFNDTYASETLNLVKSSLAQIIKNTSEEAFTELPEGKRKEWMVDIIERIEIRDVLEYNYERPVRFHYDLDNEVIYATKYFVNTFPYGRFFTRGVKENSRILIEVYLDILHELSHFYGIGITEETDVHSEYWAIGFIKNGIDELYACRLTDSDSEEDKHFILQASTGMVKEVFSEESVDYAFRDSSYLLPFIIDDEQTSVDSDQWAIMFNTHLSLGIKNSGLSLEGSLYKDFESESEEYMGDFYSSFFDSTEFSNDSSVDDISVRGNSDEDLYVSGMEIQNLVLGELDRIEDIRSELYGAFVNRVDSDNYIQWSSDYHGVSGVFDENGEELGELSVKHRHTFKINNDLSATFKEELEVLNPEVLNLEQLDLFLELNPAVTKDLQCMYKVSKINIESYLGEEVDLGVINKN